MVDCEPLAESAEGVRFCATRVSHLADMTLSTITEESYPITLLSDSCSVWGSAKWPAFCSMINPSATTRLYKKTLPKTEDLIPEPYLSTLKSRVVDVLPPWPTRASLSGPFSDQHRKIHNVNSFRQKWMDGALSED